MSPPEVQIHIVGLECFGRHGVYAEERELGQRFVVDATIDLSVCRGAESDDIADTIDYAGLTERIAAIIEGPPVALLEHLAHLIALEILTAPTVAHVAVTVHKPHVALPRVVTETAVTVRLARSE